MVITVVLSIIVAGSSRFVVIGVFRVIAVVGDYCSRI